MNMFDRDRRKIDDLFKESMDEFLRGKGDIVEFLRERADEIARKNGYTHEELEVMFDTVSKIKDRKHFTALIASLIEGWHRNHHEQDKIFESLARIATLIFENEVMNDVDSNFSYSRDSDCRRGMVSYPGREERAEKEKR